MKAPDPVIMFGWTMILCGCALMIALTAKFIWMLVTVI